MRAREPNTGRFAKAPPKKNGKKNGNGHAHDAEPAPWTYDALQVARARAMPKRENMRPFVNPFRVAEVPPSVFPKGTKQQLGMDTFPGMAWGNGFAGAQEALFAAYDANVNFIGYPTLAVLAQLPEYRNISETIATEMTRKWIRFHKRSKVKDEVEPGEEGDEPQAEGEFEEEGENENAETSEQPEQRQAGDKGPIDDLKAVMALALAQQTEEFSDDPLDNEEVDQQESAGEVGEEGEPGGGETDPNDPDRETDTTGEDDDKIKELEDAFDRLGVRDVFAQTAVNDGFFGRSHIFLDFGDGGTPDNDQTDFNNPEVKKELLTPIGDGRGDMSKMKCSPEHPLKRLVPTEPTWAYPANYDASNPLAPNWYNPVTWYVQQNEIHRDRFLTFVGRPVPDLLKPAFAFGGLSLTQMAKPTVDNWLRTRRGVGDIINSFSIFVLSTNLNQNLSGGSDFLNERALQFNATRDNQGLMLIDKNQEEFLNIAAPLSTLDVLQAQSQEHMCSVSRIPIVKLLGVQPAGLNADSEGVIRTFYDSINAFQHKFFRKHLQTISWFVQLSLWGEVDEDIDFDFEPLWELDELQKAQKRKSDADTDNVLIQAGVIDPEEARQRVANDPDAPYQEIDPNDVPEPPEPEMPPGGGLGGGGGGFGGPPKPPGAGPAGPKPKTPSAKPSNTKGGSPATGDSMFPGLLEFLNSLG